MRSVNVDFLRPGQTVADVVTNAQGAVLCPTGYQLTEKAIARLKSANVRTVWIEGSKTPPIDIQARLDAVERRFDGVNDPVLLKIKALVRSRYERLQEEFRG